MEFGNNDIFNVDDAWEEFVNQCEQYAGRKLNDNEKQIFRCGFFFAERQFCRMRRERRRKFIEAEIHEIFAEYEEDEG